MTDVKLGTTPAEKTKRKLVNGKHYPLWQQFADRQAEFIGGTLQDLDRSFPSDGSDPTTKITSIELNPNGKDSAFFMVNGEDFSCGFCVSVGGVTSGEEGWLTFCGYQGHTWRIKKPAREVIES